MNATTTAGFMAAFKARWSQIGKRISARHAKRAERRAARAAKKAEMCKFHHVATIRGTVVVTNDLTGHDERTQAYAYLLENGYGDRDIETNFEAMEDTTPVKAFLRGMSMADVKKMKATLGYTIA